jgi:hypothetical protein
MRRIFRPEREDVQEGWEKIMRKITIRILHQTLKSSSVIIELNFVGVR